MPSISYPPGDLTSRGCLKRQEEARFSSGEPLANYHIKIGGDCEVGELHRAGHGGSSDKAMPRRDKSIRAISYEPPLERLIKDFLGDTVPAAAPTMRQLSTAVWCPSIC